MAITIRNEQNRPDVQETTTGHGKAGIGENRPSPDTVIIALERTANLIDKDSFKKTFGTDKRSEILAYLERTNYKDNKQAEFAVSVYKWAKGKFGDNAGISMTFEDDGTANISVTEGKGSENPGKVIFNGRLTKGAAGKVLSKNDAKEAETETFKAMDNLMEKKTLARSFDLRFIEFINRLWEVSGGRQMARDIDKFNKEQAQLDKENNRLIAKKQAEIKSFEMAQLKQAQDEVSLAGPNADPKAVTILKRPV